MTEIHTLRLLLVSNDRPVKILLEREISNSGPLAVAFQAGDEIQDWLGKRHFDVTELDFELPSVGRIETRRRHRDGDSSEVVLIENRPSTADAVVESNPAPAAAAASGDTAEYKFLTLPLNADELDDLATEAEKLQTAEELDATRLAAESGIVASCSPAMRTLLEIVQRVAAGSASVLIHGETGTGKTLIARHIHNSSPRTDQRFVAINCSAFQDQLLESELFGHEKGAFTGAVKAKPGLFEVAHNGTLFLDEIAEMTSAMQAKLLQILDAGELRRVGGTETQRVDVRIIAASNKDLQHEVRAGRFREDLLFRLNVIHLRVPPLRERPEDIAALVEHFLDRCRLPGRLSKLISPEVIQLLKAYAWPGNVRELANVIEGLILLAPGQEIQAKDLPPNLRPVGDLELSSSETPLPLNEIERLHILRAVRFTDGKKAPAARLLGIDIKTLNSKIRGYEIQL